MPSTRILFVDSRVANYLSLIDSLTEPAEVFVLDASSDGLTQMATMLDTHAGIDVINVIAGNTQDAMHSGCSIVDGTNVEDLWYGFKVEQNDGINYVN